MKNIAGSLLLVLFSLPCLLAQAVLPPNQQSLITNGGFEGQEGNSPTGWILSSKTEGKWEFSGKTGRSISVSGEGQTSSYWKSENNPFAPNTTYRLSFSVQTNGVGTAIAGSHLANIDLIDLQADTSWQSRDFIFTTPQHVTDAFLRFGQWQFDGKVYFDNISLVKVTPVHRHRNNLELGKGELIHDGEYVFYSDFTEIDGNVSRCLLQHSASFNTDRWILSAQDEIVYAHTLPDQSQQSGVIRLQVQKRDNATLLVECDADGNFSTGAITVKEIDKNGQYQVQIPTQLLPSNSIFIRLKSTGDCQIIDYQYQAQLEDDALQFIGDTNYVEVLSETGAVDVSFKTIGDLNSGDHNQVVIDIANLINYSLELEATLQITPLVSTDTFASNDADQGTSLQTITPGRRTFTVGVAETWEVHWTDYRLQQVGNYEMQIEVADRFYGEPVFLARIPFHVPILYQANYGEIVSQDSTLATVWWADSTRKISRQQVPPTNQTSLIRLSTAKNEHEPFQLVIRPKYRLSQVTVACSNFVSDQNDLIEANRVQINKVDYVLVRHPSDSVGVRGYWPDPLLPHTAPLELDSRQNYPFWLTFYTPSDLPAGIYRGSVIISGTLGTDAILSEEKIRQPVEIRQQLSATKQREASIGYHLNCIDASGAQSRSAEIEVEDILLPESMAEQAKVVEVLKEGSIWQETIEVELEVWDFTLSDEAHVRSSFGFDPENVRKYHLLTDDQELDEVLEKYYQNFANHRISPQNPMQTNPIFTDFEGNWWIDGEQDSTVKIEGNHSLKVVDDDATANVAAININLISIDSTKSYELSWHVKTEKLQQPYQVSIVCLDQNSDILQIIDLPFVGSGTWEKEWTQIGAFPTETEFIRIGFFPARASESGTKTGTAWFDATLLSALPTGENLIPDPNFERSITDWNITLDTQRFEPVAKRYLDQFHFNTFHLPLEGMGHRTLQGHRVGEIEGHQVGTPEYEILFSGYLTQLQNYLESGGWLEKAYAHWFDEPVASDYQFVKAGMDRIHQVAPKISRLLTEQVEPELIDSVDVWCPIVPNFNPSRAQERKENGDQVWWHIRSEPKAPYVGLFIDHNAIDLRMWLWQTWYYGVDGIRIWQTNYWTSQDKFPDQEAGQMLQNPYLDPISYSSGSLLTETQVSNWGNGDGRLIYPPKSILASYYDTGQLAKSTSGPINSIRLEILREGIEDYEYFWTLRDLISQEKAASPESTVAREAEGYLVVPDTVLTSLVGYTKDPTPLYAHRAVLAQMILRLTNGP